MGATRQTGLAAEELACQFLIEQGLRLIARNIRCRQGEVDIVALDHGCVVFVEVRLRRNRDFGEAAASITARKQARLIFAAQWWLNGAGRRYADFPCRFDAVLLSDLDLAALEWLPNAFTAD